MDRETISGVVRKALNKAFNKLHGQGAGLGEWTCEVKTQLCAAGQRAKLNVCASDVANANHKAWLYDVCWLRYGQANLPVEPLVDPWFDNLNEAVLIVESEWGNLGDIRDDFQKLLVGRALVRCMIYEDNKGQGDSVVNWLAGMMGSYSATASDDFYLLARYTDDGFEYWHLYGNGTVVRVT